MTTDVKDLGPLDWRVSIVDQAGKPSPEFQRRWNSQRSNNTLISTVTMRLYGGIDLMPTIGQKLFEIEMDGDEVFPVNFEGSLLGADIAPTALVILPIKVNSIVIGHGQINAGATSGTYVVTLGYKAVAGDKLGFFAPSPQDITLASLTYTWNGIRDNQ